MAACDNLYGNLEEWKELFLFLREEKPEYLRYMHLSPHHEAQGDDCPRICYIASIQDYLIKKCDLEWVKDRLQDNFDIQRMICGKEHHENYD